MSNRVVAGFRQVNSNIAAPVMFDVDAAAPESGGTGIGSPASSYVSAKEYGDDAMHMTVLTLNALPQTVVNGTEYQGSKIYDFPQGRLVILGCSMNLKQTTTSDPTTTINGGVTGAAAIGTAAASNVALTSTMADIHPSCAFTSSASQNTPGSAFGTTLASPVMLDGHATAKSAYLNTAYATTTDVDADGTQTISGTITILWANLGVSGA